MLSCVQVFLLLSFAVVVVVVAKFELSLWAEFCARGGKSRAGEQTPEVKPSVIKFSLLLSHTHRRSVA